MWQSRTLMIRSLLNPPDTFSIIVSKIPLQWTFCPSMQTPRHFSYVLCSGYSLELWCILKIASHSLWSLFKFSNCPICPLSDISRSGRNHHPITFYSLLHFRIVYMLLLFSIFTCIVSKVSRFMRTHILSVSLGPRKVPTTC